jgi:hypothetical protein
MTVGSEVDRNPPEIAAAYPDSIFRPLELCYETEDEDFVRYSDEGRSDAGEGGPVMEVVVENNASRQVYGHYLRYYGLRNRAVSIIRKLQVNFISNIWFSEDFREAAIIEGVYFLRLQKRGLNFYMTHLSLLSSDNTRTHDGFVSQVTREFRQIPHQEILKMRLDGKTKKAIEKLLAIKADRGSRTPDVPS